MIIVLQEEEKRLKPGTHKSVMFTVLRHATVEGMTIQDIINKAVEMGFTQFEEAQKSSLSAVSQALSCVHRRGQKTKGYNTAHSQTLICTHYLPNSKVVRLHTTSTIKIR